MAFDTSAIPNFDTMTAEQQVQALLSIDTPAPAKTNAAQQNAPAGNTVPANAPSVEQDAAIDDDPDHPGETPEERIQRLTNELAIEKRKAQAASSEAAARKRELREKDSKTQVAMTAQERQIADLQRKMETLQQEREFESMKSRILDLGLTGDAAIDTAKAWQDDDKDTFFANIKSWNAECVRSAKSEALRQTPYPRNGTATPEITKEQAKKMTLPERTELYNRDRELYNQLFGG